MEGARTGVLRKIMAISWADPVGLAVVLFCCDIGNTTIPHPGLPSRMMPA